MKKAFSLYYLYCVHKECGASVYKRMDVLQLPFTPENMAGVQYCKCCGNILLSAASPAVAANI